MSVLAAFIVPHPPIILPAVGKGEETRIQTTINSYKQVAQEIKVLDPDLIVITSPHANLHADWFELSHGTNALGNLTRFGVQNAETSVNYDSTFINELIKQASLSNFPVHTSKTIREELDHGTLIPLAFIQAELPNVKIVRIGLSSLPFTDHYRLGQLIARTSDVLQKKIIIVASGDLSHKLTFEGPYGYVKEGPVFDKMATAIMKSGDFIQFLKLDPEFCEKAAECGLRSFIIMAGTLDKKAVSPALLSYEGPFGVGYAVASFRVMNNDDERDFLGQYLAQHKKERDLQKTNEDIYVQLARLSVETYVRTGIKAQLPSELPIGLLHNKAGVFVSLHKFNELRGCVGTIAPTKRSIADEINSNGILACSKDHRFSPVQADELDDIDYSVDVLGKSEPIQSKKELDVHRYGVIVSDGYRRGLLLPDLEGVDTVEQQISIALRKAGLNFDEPYELERFEVVRHK